MKPDDLPLLEGTAKTIKYLQWMFSSQSKIDELAGDAPSPETTTIVTRAAALLERMLADDASPPTGKQADEIATLAKEASDRKLHIRDKWGYDACWLSSVWWGLYWIPEMQHGEIDQLVLTLSANNASQYLVWDPSTETWRRMREKAEEIGKQQ